MPCGKGPRPKAQGPRHRTSGTWSTQVRPRHLGSDKSLFYFALSKFLTDRIRNIRKWLSFMPLKFGKFYYVIRTTLLSVYLKTVSLFHAHKCMEMSVHRVPKKILTCSAAYRKVTWFVLSFILSFEKWNDNIYLQGDCEYKIKYCRWKHLVNSELLYKISSGGGDSRVVHSDDGSDWD